MAGKRNTLGNDALSALVGVATGETETPATATTPANTGGTESRYRPRFTVRISETLQDQVRDACYWRRETVTAFVERALRTELAKLEEEQGEPFRPRDEELRPGRPIR